MLMKTFKSFVTAAALIGAVMTLAPDAVMAQIQHRIVIHVDDNDPKKMTLALNNAANVDAYYKEKGEEVIIEIVAYGPGLNMLIKGKSPVEARIASFEENFDNISFRACGNTLNKMQKKAGMDIPLVSQAIMTVSGVVLLSERQEQGWSYIKP